MRFIDAVQHPPGSRHAGHRTAHVVLVTEDLDVETQSPPSAMATAMSANTCPGACCHGPAYVSASAWLTPSTRPVSRANSRNIPTPACDTTPVPSALTLT